MRISKDPFNVILGGVGGQGNVLASQILGEMLVSQGYVITLGETYGASQRGGAVMSHLRLSVKNQYSSLIPEGMCDLLIALEPVEGLRILEHYGNPSVMTLLNTRPIHPIDVVSGNATYPEISKVIARIQELSRRVWTLNATEVALEMGDPIFSNIIMLGALCGIEVLDINREEFNRAIKELLSSAMLDKNMEAFDKGKEMVQELPGR
jgi:indolepyruvate ferredoxin oxidoreductase beta subunit